MTGPTRFQRRSGALGGDATQGFWTPGAPENTPDPAIPYLPLEGAGAGPTPAAPTITAHPSSATSLLDATGQTFTVSVSGYPTPTLQWEQNTGSGWSNVSGGSGGTTLTYTAPTATAALNGIQYRCVATNTEGSATSNAATWTIIPARALTSGSSITDGTTFNGASITVGQNRLGIVNLVQIGVDTDDRVAPISVRIGSHELTQIGSPIAIDAFTFKTAWRCLSTSAAITGTLTMEWAASDVQDSVAWGAIEWENRDTSGTNGSGAVHTPATNAGTGTAMTVGSIADPGSSGDFVCATWAWEDANAADGQTHSPGAGLFELSESNALDTTWYGAQAISVGVKASSVAGTLSASETWAGLAFVVKVAASGTTVAPGTGHLTLSGKQPTISQTTTTTIAPGKGALTFTGYAPSILRTTVLTPGTGHLLLGGYAPTVARLATVAPGSGHMVLTTYAPSIVRTTALTPGTGHLALTGYAPTVSQSSSAAVAPGSGHLTLTGYAPTVAQTANQAVSPSAGHALLTGYVPSITRADVVAPGTGHLVLTGSAPTITQTATSVVAPGPGHLLLTGYAPTVVRTANQVVAPGAGHLVLIGYAPAVSNGGAVWPAPADVRAGVQYGPTGAEYTGTLVGGGGAYLRRR